MIRKFVDRGAELRWLNDSLDSGERQLLVIYGRRRVGKTELLTRALRGRESIYFLADQRGTESNAERFAREAAEHFDDVPPRAEGFDDVFRYIGRRSGGELVVAVDEFSYLVEKDDSVPSVFQLIWDEVLEETQVSIVLLGSSISMMEEGALSYESPLYGRRTGQWKLRPLGFRYASEFFPGYGFEDRVRAYGALGGVPAYLQKFDPEEGLIENVKSSILSRGTFLHEEPELLLRQELREPASYMDILEAMAHGATGVTEIAGSTQREAKDLSSYLKRLLRLELVEKVSPVTSGKGKRGLYVIKDNFFSFWFRFVHPHLDDLERGAEDRVGETVKDEIDVYTGGVFEEVCRQAVQLDDFPFESTKTGSWWYGGDEIDVVALDEGKDRILLGECKWTREKGGLPLLRRLEEKSSRVRWRDGNRDEVYAIFSKAGFTQELSGESEEREDLALYGPGELESLFQRSV